MLLCFEYIRLRKALWLHRFGCLPVWLSASKLFVGGADGYIAHIRSVRMDIQWVTAVYSFMHQYAAMCVTFELTTCA